MFGLFSKRSELHNNYKTIFVAWEQYFFAHEKEAITISQIATEQAIVTFFPIAEKYGLVAVHDPATLIKRVKPDDLRDMSDKCFIKAREFNEKGESSAYHGVVLAGLYFGVAGLMARGENSVRGLWKVVEKAMSMSVRLAARTARSAVAAQLDRDEKAKPDDLTLKLEPLHPKTVSALKEVSLSETKYRKFDLLRDEELSRVEDKVRNLIQEHQQLFAEIQKATEIVSPSEIYGASISMMHIFERVLLRSGPPLRLAEPEVAAAGMAKFIDRLYDADETALSHFEILSRIHSPTHEGISLLGAKVTRIVVLGRFLNFHLAKIAPLNAHEAQWLAKTLLSDLEELSVKELGPLWHASHISKIEAGNCQYDPQEFVDQMCQEAIGCQTSIYDSVAQFCELGMDRREIQTIEICCLSVALAVHSIFRWSQLANKEEASDKVTFRVLKLYVESIDGAALSNVVSLYRDRFNIYRSVLLQMETNTQQSEFIDQLSILLSQNVVGKSNPLIGAVISDLMMISLDQMKQTIQKSECFDTNTKVGH